MGNVLGEEEHNEAFCLLKPNKDKLKEGGQDYLQRERTAEDADRISDRDSRDNLLLPSASTPYNIQTFSGRRVGCGEREEAGRAFITSLTGLQCQKRHIMAHGSLPTSLPPHTHIIVSPDVNIFLPSLCPTIMQYQITEIDA